MQAIDGFEGRQLVPGDPDYDDARELFNAMIDARPALIAQCTGPADVARVIQHARAAGLPLAVRAGGHSVAGMSTNDGGVVADVRPMADVSVDARARTARCGAGATWSAFDRATQAFGLATTGGRVSTTGVTGLTIGGGSGWLERMYGFACDSLLAVELVTADGRLVRASADEHPDLFWALHGGGGNFGVVTALEFQLHEVGPMVHGGLAIYDPARAPVLLRAFRDYMATAPDAAGLAAGFLAASPEPFVPAEWHGRMVVGLVGMWAGAPDEGRAAFSPLLQAVRPIVDLFGEIPYAQLQSMIDDPPEKRHWWTGDYLGDLPDAAIDELCDYAATMPVSFTQLLLVPFGGALARDAQDTPLRTREAAWVVHPFCAWDGADGDAEHVAWGREGRTRFARWATGSTYLNFVGDEGPERIRAAFGSSYERLVTVKQSWDPDNVFSGNQNIRPIARVP